MVPARAPATAPALPAATKNELSERLPPRQKDLCFAGADDSPCRECERKQSSEALGYGHTVEDRECCCSAGASTGEGKSGSGGARQQQAEVGGGVVGGEVGKRERERVEKARRPAQGQQGSKIFIYGKKPIKKNTANASERHHANTQGQQGRKRVMRNQRSISTCLHRAFSSRFVTWRAV
jgi:hypothetical protein